MKLSVKLLLAAAFILVLLGVSLSVTSQPSFCKSCHEMNDDYQAWKVSVHKKVSCTACHIEPGAVNFVAHKISALKEVGAHLANSYENPINKHGAVSKNMPSENCTGCHKNLGKISDKDLIYDHGPHLKNNINCAYCHNRIAHPGLKGHASRIAMGVCIDCHLEKEAPVVCRTCHPANFKLSPASHDSAGWAKGHGKSGDITECKKCHFDEKRFCLDCHGVPMPHPEDWKEEHGKAKNASLQNFCGKCHNKQTFCSSCHEAPGEKK